MDEDSELGPRDVFVSELRQRLKDVLNRFPLFGLFFMHLALLVVVASYAIPENLARELKNGYSVAGISLGLFELVAYYQIIWLLAPVVTVILDAYLYHFGLMEPTWIAEARGDDD